ncbi:MAG: hypothetical protein AAFR05_10970 [Bacteroidota bacterium]
MGQEIHKIAFDPLDDQALYVTTWRRMTHGVQVSIWDSELYRVDLRTNTSTFVTTLTDHSLYILDEAQSHLVDSMEQLVFEDDRLHLGLGEPHWLDEYGTAPCLWWPT